MFKAVIFDFFDVVRRDDYKAWLKNHNFALEGGFLEVSQKMDRGEIGVEEFLRRLSTLSGQTVAAIDQEMKDGAEVDHEIVALLGQLRARYKMGLLSNAPSAFLRGILREHDLQKYFDTIVISSETGFLKPSAEAFRLVLAELGVAPGEAVFIDDNKRHVQGAARVGITSLHYTSATKLKADLGRLGLL